MTRSDSDTDTDTYIPSVTDYNGKQTVFTARLGEGQQTVITGQTAYETATVTRHFTIDRQTNHVVETIIDNHDNGTVHHYERLTPLNNIPIPGKQILGDEAVASIAENEKVGSIRFRDHAFNKHYTQPDDYDGEQTDNERLKNKPKSLSNTTKEFVDRKLQPQQEAFGWNTTITFTPTENGMRVIAVYDSPSQHVATSQYVLNTDTNTLTISSPKHDDIQTLSLTQHGHVDINYDHSNKSTIPKVSEPHDELFEYRYLSGMPISFPVFAWYHSFDTHHYLTQNMSGENNYIDMKRATEL